MNESEQGMMVGDPNEMVGTEVASEPGRASRDMAATGSSGRL